MPSPAVTLSHSLPHRCSPWARLRSIPQLVTIAVPLGKHTWPPWVCPATASAGFSGIESKTSGVWVITREGRESGGSSAPQSGCRCFSQSVTPLPRENVVVPRYRELTDAELSEELAADAGAQDNETEESACAESSIAQRHTPMEIMERSQVIRYRNMSAAAFVTSLRAHRELYARDASQQRQQQQQEAAQQTENRFSGLKSHSHCHRKQICLAEDTAKIQR